jgi:predicted DsbA family dithiol-disulfide isomerase
MPELRPVDAPVPRRDADGAVVVDWWCDLCCPDCADSVEVLAELRERVGDAVVVRLRHFPLTNHVWAVAAAQCQEEARTQGRGEEFAAHALAGLDAIDGPADYVELAEHLGLDEDAVAEALFDGRHAQRIREDHDEGRALGVRGTPTFVVDGTLVDASAGTEGALAELERLVRGALGR